MWFSLTLIFASLSFLSAQAQPMFGPPGISPYQAPIGQQGYHPYAAQGYPGQIGYGQQIPYGYVTPTQAPSLFDRFVSIGTDAIHSLTKRNTGTTSGIATNTGAGVGAGADAGSGAVAGTIPSTATIATTTTTAGTAAVTPTRSPLEIANEALQSMFGMSIPTQPAPIATNIIAPAAAAAATITTAQVIPTSTINTAATSTSTPNLATANNNPITIPLATYTTSPSTSTTSSLRKLRSRVIEPIATEVVSP